MKGNVGSFVSRVRSLRVVTAIAVRNMVRQFRRNLLLGIGIAVGMCILVVTASFTSGLTDILFNKVMVYMTGHIRVVMDSYTTRRSDVIRDVPRIMAAIKENVPGIVRVDQTVSAFGRSVGNGKTGLVALVGISRDSDFYKDTQLDSGSTKDLFKADVFPGIIMYKNAAKDINVGMNDIVTVRFQTVYGQSQAPKFKVVGLIPSQNMFMDVAAFVDMDEMRTLLNLRPEESLGLNIVTSYPGNAQKVVLEANKLYKALTPGVAGVKAELSLGAVRTPADVFALQLENNPKALKIAIDNLTFVKGDVTALARNKDGIVLTEAAAKALGAGRRLAPPVPLHAEVLSRPRAEGRGGAGHRAEGAVLCGQQPHLQTRISSTRPSSGTSQGTRRRWPPDAPLVKALLPEWDLLERSPNTDAATKKNLRLNRENWKGAKVDVQTMYENASVIVDLQRGLNTVSIVAVLVLFFVILIGVVNTMRMSIRERTREIGTTRAIGMQRSDVRSVFVLEIVILAVVRLHGGPLPGLWAHGAAGLR